VIPLKKFTAILQFISLLDLVDALLISVFYLKFLFQIRKYFKFHPPSIFSSFRFCSHSFYC
jgi:hypothetical protein